MLKFDTITIKNFLSVGNVTQSINLNTNLLTLILGENLDIGEGNGARNGVGKSTVLQAISYALYDNSMTGIKKDNLINKINSKDMVVSLTFSKNNTKYKVVRGRRKNTFKLYINGHDVEENNEAQGEMKDTQKELDKIIGMSFNLFKQIVALNTFTVPFLSLRDKEQREIIEELLGITQLSEKAEILKKTIKIVRDDLKSEQIRIEVAEDNNKRIQQNINDLIKKSENFESTKTRELLELQEVLSHLTSLDVETEISQHLKKTEYNNLITDSQHLSKNLKHLERRLREKNSQSDKITQQLEKIKNQICPTCNQTINDNHSHLNENLESEIQTLLLSMSTLAKEIEQEHEKHDLLSNHISNLGNITTFYDTIAEAYEHKNTIDQLQFQLKETKDRSNPFVEQIKTLTNTALRPIDYTVINELSRLLEHQEFLLKLLTNKDSFIRKRIIDQNLSYLNIRLAHYLQKLGLPHDVRFLNDLNVEIIYLGQEFDFGNLSRGEQRRLELSLSWAFRDVWSNTNEKINILFIDEVLDGGLDPMAVEASVGILKGMSRDHNMDIFLISHREDLIARVSNVMYAIKESGFTTYQNDNEMT